MSRPSTPSTTAELPVPAERPQQASVDLDAELHYAEMLRDYAEDDEQPVEYREWEIEKKLGSGGMGTVYLARHRELGRRVALKVVKPELSGDAKERAARMIREAQALARVNHDNVLRIHQVDSSGERSVIEMEFIDGPTLREWQAQPGRSWRAIVAAYADAGEGLAAIHRAGILHRDIKPDNLLVDQDDRVKVADLGLAVAARSPKVGRAEPVLHDNSLLGLELTADGAWVGTPGYMAPEVIAGSGAREASDQFSLAASLYEAVYGVRPFVGESPRELAIAMESGRLAKPKDKRRRPRWLARVLRRALRIDPDRRYPSVAAFVTALRRRLALRAWIGRGLGSAALLIGVPAAVWFGKPDQCAEAGAELAAVWNPEVRAELRSKADEGSIRALTLLEGTLDARSVDWVAAHSQLCMSTRRAEQGEQHEHELDARQRACLSYVRANLDALIGQLRIADAELTRKFTESAAAIEALPSCADRRELRNWPLADSDDAEVEAELAAALAREIDGDLAEAAALARQAAERSAEHDPLRHAEALYRLGHVLGQQRHDRVAVETLDQARNVAFTIGHDELFCRATAFLAKLGANVMNDAFVARRELGLAQACVERVGVNSPILLADLLEARGLLADELGDPSAAISWHEQALKLRSEHLGDDHFETIKSLRNLVNARSLADPSGGQASEIERDYARLEELRIQVFGPQHAEVADVLVDFGQHLWRRGEVEAARRQLERAREIYRDAPGVHARELALVHSLLASMAITAGELELAAAQLERSASFWAAEAGAGWPEPERATWLHLDGALALQLGQYRRAADSSRRVTRLYRRLDPRSEAAFDSLVTELVADYWLRDYARIAALVRDEGEELPAYLRSLPAGEAGPTAWSIALALKDQGQWSDAKLYLEIALADYEASGDPSSIGELRARLDEVEAELERSNKGTQDEK